ncbi:MAG: hypothetical protein Sw1PiTSA_11120 [Shewanella algae]
MGAMNSSQIEIKCLANGMGPYMGSQRVTGSPVRERTAGDWLQRERQDSQIFSVVTYQRLTPATSFLAAQKVFRMSCLFIQKSVVIYQRLAPATCFLAAQKVFRMSCLFTYQRLTPATSFPAAQKVFGMSWLLLVIRNNLLIEKEKAPELSDAF